MKRTLRCGRRRPFRPLRALRPRRSRWPWLARHGRRDRHWHDCGRIARRRRGGRGDILVAPDQNKRRPRQRRNSQMTFFHRTLKMLPHASALDRGARVPRKRMKAVIGLAGGAGSAASCGNQGQDCDRNGSEERRRPHPSLRGSAALQGHPPGERDAYKSKDEESDKCRTRHEAPSRRTSRRVWHGGRRS
jgi:hypothetical protein